MGRPKNDPRAPNSAIDTAIRSAMREAKNQPFEAKLKAINTAIAWEKVKYAIREDSAGSFFGEENNDTSLEEETDPNETEEETEEETNDDNE